MAMLQNIFRFATEKEQQTLSSAMRSGAELNLTTLEQCDNSLGIVIPFLVDPFDFAMLTV
jgi:hypothetical protein